jgi:hypothetical protein
MKMNKRKLSIIIGIATLAIICTTVAAQMIASFTTTHQLSISGMGVDVLEWVSDTATPTVLFESYNWGDLGREEQGNSTNIIVYGSGTVNSTLDFINDLDSSIGTIKWQIEVNVGGGATGWQWRDWQSYLDSGDFMVDQGGGKYTYAPGSPQNPLETGEYVGMRTTAQAHGDLGRVRLTLTVDALAPMGPVSAFTTTATATEIV